MAVNPPRELPLLLRYCVLFFLLSKRQLRGAAHSSISVDGWVNFNEIVLLFPLTFSAIGGGGRRPPPTAVKSAASRSLKHFQSDAATWNTQPERK